MRQLPIGSWSKPIRENFTRYRVSVSYLGTPFAGWHSTEGHHKHAKSVADVLQQAVVKFAGEDNVDNFKGSSRTDIGVHAIRNVFQVDLRTKSKDQQFPCHNVMNGINYHLRYSEKNPIIINDVSIEDEAFDARSSAIARTYVYKINHMNIYHNNVKDSRNRMPLCPTNIFQFNKTWSLKFPLNIDKMNTACNYLIGEKDFSSFRGSCCQSVTPFRFLQQIKVVRQQKAEEDIFKLDHTLPVR